MTDRRETNTFYVEGDALIGSGNTYRGGLESLDAPKPRGTSQIQAATGSSPQNQATSNSADPYDAKD